MANEADVEKARSNITTLMDCKKMHETLKGLESLILLKTTELKSLKERHAVILMEIRGRLDGEEPLLPM